MNTFSSRTWLVALAPVALLVAGCPADDLTLAEAQEAVEEASLASQAASVAEGTVELTTSFTLGQAVENAAEEIRAFAESQLPCADVSLSGATVTIVYGVNGTCTWHGNTITGTHRVTVSKNDEAEVLVQHEWQDVSNGRVEVDGSADVTWDLEAKSRHVVHELTWTRLSDGRSATGSGDRLQSPLGGSWEDGISVDGERAWEGEAGRWELSIDQVGWRWEDPVPETGAYVVTTPKDKTLTMSFERVDEDTIHVTVEGTRRSFGFDVTKKGVVQGGTEQE